MKQVREERLLNPQAGSKAAAARDFGIDLTLLVRNLRKTPTERLLENEQILNDLIQLESAMRDRRKRQDSPSK